MAEQAPLPRFLAYGSGLGVLLLGGSAILSYFADRALAGLPQGSESDPFPPRDPTPADEDYVQSVSTPWTPTELGEAIRRRWKTLFSNEILTDAQVAMLLAEAAIATNNGKGAVAYNALGLRADRFWTGSWTAVPEPFWKNGRPAFRWAPVRAYVGWDFGVHDWLKLLPEGAIAAVRAADPAAFAKTLALEHWASGPLTEYEPQMVAQAAAYLDWPSRDVPV